MTVLEISAYIALIFFIMLTAIIIFVSFFFGKWANKNLASVLRNILTEGANTPISTNPGSSTIPTIKELLRKDCIDETKIKNFFFMDDSTITKLYSQIDPLQQIEQTKKTLTDGKKELAVNSNLPIVNAEASSVTTNTQQVETVSRYLPLNSSYCNRVMRRLHDNQEVFILDIERNYKSNIREIFEDSCKTLTKECHVSLPEYWLKTYREQIMEYAISDDDFKDEIINACQDKRYVLTKGNFTLAPGDINIFTKNIGNGKVLIEIPFNPEKAEKDRIMIIKGRLTGNFTVFGTFEFDIATSKITIIPIVMY